VEKPGDAVKRLLAPPSALEHHRVDGFTHGEVPQFRVVGGGVVDDGAHPECVEPASHQAEVVSNLAPVCRWVRPHHLRCW
jgi:hypothetical protein